MHDLSFVGAESVHTHEYADMMGVLVTVGDNYFRLSVQQASRLCDDLKKVLQKEADRKGVAKK